MPTPIQNLNNLELHHSFPVVNNLKSEMRVVGAVSRTSLCSQLS